MLRGLLIGFLAGALLAGLAFKLIQSRQPSGGEAGGASEAGGGKGGRPAGGGGDGGAPSAELASARAEAETLRAKVKDLEAQLLESKKQAAGKAGSKLAGKWKELASLIAQAKKEADASGAPINNEKFVGTLLEMIGIFANEVGLPIQEAFLSPDWYPVFAQSMLDASPYPLSDEQKKQVADVLAASRQKWDAYVAARDGMSPLERDKALHDLQFEMFGKLAPIGTEEQKAWMDSLKLPPPGAPNPSVWDGAGPRAACKQNIANNLSKAIGLDGNQMTALSPVIDDYMRGYEAIAKEAEFRRKAGEPYDDVSAKLSLAIELQKNIGGTVRLTDAQAKALKDWAQVHDYQVKE